MVSGGMACVKYVLFLFNLIFAITGIVFIAAGATVLIMYKGYSNFVNIWVFMVPVLVIVVGVVVFTTSFFGCCGAVKENHCMIITFSLLLLLIFALETGVAITGYMMRSKVDSMLESCFNDTLAQYNTRKDYLQSWDIIQYDLECCGVHGPTDWQRAGFIGNRLPATCCKELPINNRTCELNSDPGPYSRGCKQALQNTLEKNGLILLSVGIGVALVQLLGVIFACCLARSVRREYETVY
ncbi:CD63 antigen [Copidosoma floridanum]|uniref:CD63 antigen n=1 Tax=Copidosoma floridanum TaxID=29053 RepID=UPI000C6F5BC2|nr:CD63 antigen [Copidosoma floridanum]